MSVYVIEESIEVLTCDLWV